jgi:hypothetical protein
MIKFSQLDPILQRKRTTLVSQLNNLRNEVKTQNQIIHLIEDGKDIKTSNLFEVNL